MKLDKIDNQSVVNVVVERIKNSIIKEELKPGDKIPTEVELIEQLGVGRNSVREAIKMLTALGILEVRRGQGTYVVTKVNPSFFDPLIFSLIIEPKSNRDLYELRVMFDSMVLFNVIEKVSDEEILMIEQEIMDTEQKYKENKENIDVEYFVKRDCEFHYMILELTKNPLIIRIGQAILGLFQEYIKKSILQQNGIERSIKNHVRILDTIKKRDRNNVLDIVENTLIEWKEEWKNFESK
ncbi:FadR/GntR family transcriptional regulator [Clostridium grantii]|uniref:DNA-binding transcriptional regulator, FadR family n=1 Tax=Clostridium grantii DSM 8605 TaxID=1121316 RepID=A0A1M5WH87_9CLOT|nr:FadR/GntR family transcriptional regulator [Clostridium grantii]SHH86909.1 DNA-binding transcriptional regulator, FadR family [Clostridium grantii DSM 8605]